jgi:hypothetical protein
MISNAGILNTNARPDVDPRSSTKIAFRVVITQLNQFKFHFFYFLLDFFMYK